MSKDYAKHNQRLLWSIVIISVVLIARLLDAAITYNNWPGFFYSLLHILLVAGVSLFTLRRRA